MLKNFIRLFAGDPSKRTLDKFADLVQHVNELEKTYEQLSDAALRDKTAEFRQRLADGETLDDLMPEAFAAVREASKRTLGLRHYDVQIIGGAVLHQGSIAEMRTGEGKTLVATLPLYLNALTGKGCHLVTVNDYLARRDARWMAPIYHLLGLSVGVLQMAARTENGKKAFLVDLERESPHEDQHQLRLAPRAEAYAADITYGTNSEFGFDYLRDNMTLRLSERVQRGHFYAIVDEVDNVLIDEARTPLIISGPAYDDTEWYTRMAQVVRQLKPEDYEINEKDRTVTLTEIGEAHVEELLGMALRDPERPEDVTPEQARLLGYLEQAMRAQFLFKRNKDYLVQAGKVVIVDEFTGRLMPGRRWSDGLHQAVEAKEGVRVQAENVTYATITIQNYFRMYKKLAGMSGTAITEAEEFNKIYKLDVHAIPTNLEYLASRPDSPLVELEGRDEQGYKYHYYARRDDHDKKPVFWKRKDYPDVVYRTEEAKFRAICREILRLHVLGRPILVGTTSVELSERLSNRLRAEPLRRLAQVLVLRAAWFEQNNQEEDGRQIAELQFLNEPLDKLDPAEMRKLARQLGISANPQDAENLSRLQTLLDLPEESTPRLTATLNGGISHEVLNARKHTEESQIIAGAGAFGAVTIATNMAGRGVDIKLGGELPEEIIAEVNRILHRAGYADSYDMTMEQRRQALLQMDHAEYGIYESQVQAFLKFMDDMERVKSLGGLHVIGSERHEARRIDNQLRGRAARQGDPGSSRFYLSMQDELMRLFGGQQAEALMQRLRIDDALPLEVGLVGRLVEQSQTRVEGANFDVRKHLLEYDDVLNTQRQRIYSQRDLIFTKDDLSEDVSEMLRAEVLRRVPEALKDPEGPWRLIAWLDQIQPTHDLGGALIPSYMIQLLLEYLKEQSIDLSSPASVRAQLIALARQALEAEQEHLLASTRNLLDHTRSRMEDMVQEIRDALDTFFASLEDEQPEEGTALRSPRELAEELAGLTRLPLRLTPEQQRLLRSDPDQVRQLIQPQVEAAIRQQALTRLVGAIERRMEESPGLDVVQLARQEWDEIEQQVLTTVNRLFNRRIDRLVGEGDQLGKELDIVLARLNGNMRAEHLTSLLLMMPLGSRTTFDKKTHRRVSQQTARLTYTYFAGHLLEGRDPEQAAEDVLAHLERTRSILQTLHGMSAWQRLSSARWSDLDEPTRKSLQAALSEDACRNLETTPLHSLPPDEAQQAIQALGRRALTEIYRQLLLGVITELWVDYLTQMEALRVSIGLEAYGQRDPLVQYKSRASELFQNLLRDMRLGVVSRMFTYRPRDLEALQFGLKPEQEIAAELSPAAASEQKQVEASIDAGDDAEEAELAEETPAETVAPSGAGQTISRSQKRRRRRR